MIGEKEAAAVDLEGAIVEDPLVVDDYRTSAEDPGEVGDKGGPVGPESVASTVPGCRRRCVIAQPEFDDGAHFGLAGVGIADDHQVLGWRGVGHNSKLVEPSSLRPPARTEMNIGNGQIEVGKGGEQRGPGDYQRCGLLFHDCMGHQGGEISAVASGIGPDHVMGFHVWHQARQLLKQHEIRGEIENRLPDRGLGSVLIPIRWGVHRPLEHGKVPGQEAHSSARLCTSRFEPDHGIMVGMTAINEIIGYLEQWEPFSLLDPEQRSWAASRCTVEYQRAGSVLLAAGVDNDELMLIVKGAAELRDGEEALVTKLAEGECIGVLSAVTGQPVRQSSVLAEDTVFCRFGGDVVAKLRSDSVTFDRDLLEVVEERLIAPRHQSAERANASGSGLAAGPSPLMVPVRTIARSPAVVTEAHTPVVDAARRMTEQGVSSILVVDERGCPMGLVTDRDLRSRVVAGAFDVARPVSQVMTSDLITIGEHAPAFEALITMTEHNVHHLPVVDGTGAAMGFVSITDLHVASTTDPVFVVGQLAKAVDVDQVEAIVASVPRMIQQLMAAGALAETVGRMVTMVTDAASRRLCRLAEERLGPPPMEYALFCFGSQARREQTAYSDQDNALILARKPDRDERSYFDQLARFVCDGLAQAGYRLCPGDIMATNRRWSVSLDTWKRYVDAWVTAPTPEAVLNAAVFFDARHLHGRAELTDEYRRWSVHRAQASPLFLGHLAAAGIQFKPPLGFFRRFVVEKDGGHKDQLDLKGRGVTPVIELARVHTLAHGLMETNTFDRIRALAGTPALAPDDAAELAVALEHVGYYRLQHQRRQLEVGRQPDNHLDPQSLTRLERENLRRAFVTIDKMQDALRRRFHTNQMA